MVITSLSGDRLIRNSGLSGASTRPLILLSTPDIKPTMSLLSPLLWSFVPSQLAAVLIPYASQVLPSLFPPAPKGTPVYARNYRWIYSSLIVGYLAWTWCSGDDSDNWYALLGVPRWADDDALKKAFRNL